MLPSLQRLPLAACAPPDRAETTGMFGSDDETPKELARRRAGPYVAPPPLHDYDGNELRPLANELLLNAYAIRPFSMAFHAPLPPPAEQRWVAKEGLDTYAAPDDPRRPALSTIRAVRRWVKIGGKNGMDPVDVQDMLNGSPRDTLNAMLSVFLNDYTVGYVFDGDNYEPDKAPFSVIIGELIANGHTVVAVKQVEPRMVDGHEKPSSVSKSFYKGWEALAIAHPETFLMAIVQDTVKKEDVTRKADAFVFWGSTYVSEKTGRNYRFKPDHSPTQGWTEIQEFKEDNELVCRELGATFLAVKNGF